MRERDRTELLTRLRQIEEMMGEGRRTSQGWGWMFLLWGSGPLAAMFWEDCLRYPALAWPLAMAVCVIVKGIVLQPRKRRGEARTAMMQSVGAVWCSVGVAVPVIALGAAWSGALDLRALCVALFALAAVAHSASGVMLRWTPQLPAALVGLRAGLAAFLLPATGFHLFTAVAILPGNVVFGAWLTCLRVEPER
jgi:hypothetical protein